MSMSQLCVDIAQIRKSEKSFGDFVSREKPRFILDQFNLNRGSNRLYDIENFRGLPWSAVKDEIHWFIIHYGQQQQHEARCQSLAILKWPNLVPFGSLCFPMSFSCGGGG